jgi:hypothetical protein
MQGGDFLESAADEGTRQFLSDLGVTAEDVAFASAASPLDSEARIGIFALRASGVPTDLLLRVFKETSDEDSETPLQWEQVTVGGKQVERTMDPTGGEQLVHLYAHDDVLYLVSADTEGQIEEAFAFLP